MNLSDARKKIDAIDEELLELYIERMKISGEIAKIKSSEGAMIRNIEREREILKHVSEKSGEYEQYTHRLFTTIMEQSRVYQGVLMNRSTSIRNEIEESLCMDRSFPKTGTVACQGIEGAYSSLAAQKLFPRGNLTFFKSFEGVFDAVREGFCDYGILPVENSSAGSVRAVYELLRTKNLSIIRSTKLCVAHKLLVKPGVKLSEVNEIYSHEQALGQCSAFLKSLGENVKINQAANTAVAAKIVSESENRYAAAIASPECAGFYGLSACEADIMDSENNYTRFVCIAAKPCIYAGSGRISLVISCDHRPGALYEVLAKFASCGVNIYKIESCPLKGHDFEFIFFFEIEGNAADPMISVMLSELEAECKELKYLGCYLEV